MKRLLAAFNMNNPDERNRAFLLFAYNFLATSIMVMGRIVRDTLFLNKYKGDRLMLSFMYIGVAILVSTATFFYTKRSSFYRMDKLITATFSIGIVFTLIFVGLVNNEISAAFGSLYIFIELLGAFMMFQFWSFTNELLDSREAKRVLGFVGCGGIIASMAVGGSVGKLAALLGQVQYLLFINALCMAICILIVRFMGQKYQSRLQRGVVSKTLTPKQAKEATSHISISKTPYVKYIAIMIALIYVVVTLVDYQFKIVASDTITDPQKLAAYFGFVYSVFGGVFSLFFQLVATSRLLKFSIFMSLGILPAILTLSSIFFISVPPDLVMFGLAAPLVAITMAKSGDSAFRYTINDAAIQLLYIPLDPKIKSRTKAIIDGMVKPIFIGVSGFILLAVSYLGKAGIVSSDVKLISWIVTVIGISWLLTIVGIRSRYLSVLIDNIKKKRFGTNQLTMQPNVLQSIVQKAIESGDDEDLSMAIDMVESSGNSAFGRDFVALLSKATPKIKVKILSLMRRMESRYNTYNILKLFKDSDEEVLREAILTYGYIQMDKSVKFVAPFLDSEKISIREAAVIALIKYAGVVGAMTAGSYLKAFFESENATDRAAAAYILGELGQKNMDQQLSTLLNDPSPIVRRAAVNAASKIDSNVFIPKLFYMLFDKDVSFDVAKVLSKFGEKILEPAADILANKLESYRLKSEVAKMLGDIYTPESFRLLAISLDTESDELRNIVLNSLKKLVSKIEKASIEKEPLKVLLLREIYQYFQTLYFSVQIRKNLKTDCLTDVMATKLDNCYQRIFSILSLMYGNSLFDNIYFNITRKFVLPSQRANALEIIDNIVDKDIRPIIVPLIESRTEEEKLGLGYQFFSIKKLKIADIIETLLSDDSEWVRSVTLYAVAHEHITEDYGRIQMFLYDPSPIVREAALYAMNYVKIMISETDAHYLLNDTDRYLCEYSRSVLQPEA
ncbi:HEAT repeat domain-containing protein [bacterium]|nr:HEAT repeat domain-containing protein [bacterium]